MGRNIKPANHSVNTRHVSRCPGWSARPRSGSWSCYPTVSRASFTEVWQTHTFSGQYGHLFQFVRSVVGQVLMPSAATHVSGEQLICPRFTWRERTGPSLS